MAYPKECVGYMKKLNGSTLWLSGTRVGQLNVITRWRMLESVRGRTFLHEGEERIIPLKCNFLTPSKKGQADTNTQMKLSNTTDKLGVSYSTFVWAFPNLLISYWTFFGRFPDKMSRFKFSGSFSRCLVVWVFIQGFSKPFNMVLRGWSTGVDRVSRSCRWPRQPETCTAMPWYSTETPCRIVDCSLPYRRGGKSVLLGGPLAVTLSLCAAGERVWSKLIDHWTNP